MSGHSKWHQIKYKKGIADNRRGQVFTRHAKLITIAARDGGGDPNMNPTLRSAIANARAENMPNLIIERAIKKGTGEDKESAQFLEIMYEGFGPAGTAIYVQAITDNRNRSVNNVKNIFAKNGGNVGSEGTVGWMFERKGVIIAEAEKMSEEEAEMAIIDCGAEDFSLLDKGVFEVTTGPTDLMKVRDVLEKNGFVISKAELRFVPKNFVKMETVQDAQKVLRLIEALEEDEDVANVYANFDIPEEIMEKL